MNTHTEKQKENKRESAANAISKGHKNKTSGTQLEDNRPHPKLVTQLQGIIQKKDPVGTGEGTDDDRKSIEVESLSKDENVNLEGDWNNRATFASDFIVNKKNYKEVIKTNRYGEHKVNNVLKHYMVVKDGDFRYQFPIKYFKQPKETYKNSGEYIPNAGYEDKDRGGQPEGFGGNADMSKTVIKGKNSLLSTRNETLNKEYQEENLNHEDAKLTFGESKKFGSKFGAGTLTIATTDKKFKEGAMQNVLKEKTTKNRGEAEMAGTIVIDCSDLVVGDLKGNDLEHAIVTKLQLGVDKIFKKKEERLSILEKSGGILAHLIGMVAEDIEFQRKDKKEDVEEKKEEIKEDKVVDEIKEKIDENLPKDEKKEDSLVNKGEITSVVKNVVGDSKTQSQLQKDTSQQKVTNALVKFISNPVIVILIAAIVISALIKYFF